MILLQCKVCGGNIELSTDQTLGTCDCCGRTVTVPKNHSPERTEMFNRGNYFRRIGEFDQALRVFEQIIKEDYTDAEAHWCCALCRFGIEYVEDPASHEWVPTCHRVSYDSFLQDIDYITALAYSDNESKSWYETEAVKINEIQKRILAASQNEEDYDIFICYKETDANGERTRDSVIAQDIYDRLKEKDYRVFFARITLENKPGVEYEPYIFAGLNSAKVMIVVGTSKENLDAVWVKNEWSRFIVNMKKDSSKVLIPCYADMNPYDLPDSLARLQSYDVNKIGFIQDLVHGIGKIVGKKEAAHAVNIDDAVNKHLQKVSEQQALSRIERGNAQFRIGMYKDALDYYADGLATLNDDFTAQYRKTLCTFYLAGENPPVNQLEEVLKKPSEAEAVLPDEEKIAEKDLDLMAYIRAYLDTYFTCNRHLKDERECRYQAGRIYRVLKVVSTVALYIDNEKNLEDMLLLIINSIDNWMKTEVTYFVTTNKGTKKVAYKLAKQEQEALKQIRNTCSAKYNSMGCRAQGEAELQGIVKEKETILSKLKEELAQLKQQHEELKNAFWEQNPEQKKQYDHKKNVSVSISVLCIVLALGGAIGVVTMLKSLMMGLLILGIGIVLAVSTHTMTYPKFDDNLLENTEMSREIEQKDEAVKAAAKEYTDAVASVERYRKDNFIADM